MSIDTYEPGKIERVKFDDEVLTPNHLLTSLTPKENKLFNPLCPSVFFWETRLVKKVSGWKY